MGAGEFALNCALRVLQGWRFSLDNSTPAMFAMRIVAVNRHVRGKRNDIGKGSARPVCAGRDEVRIESVGRTRSRQESLTQRLQLHKGGRSEILQGTAHSNVDGSGTVAAYHLAGSCRKHEWSSYAGERNRPDELIVGVYDPNKIDNETGEDREWMIPRAPSGQSPVRMGLMIRPAPDEVAQRPLARALLPGGHVLSTGSCTSRTGMTPSKNGGLPSAGGYNTVLVTQLGDTADECLSVTVKNTRSGGASIKLALVPATGANTRPLPEPDRQYFQNYFRVADADFESDKYR